MRRALAMVVVLAATTAFADAPKPGDMVNNPPYAHWAQFPVGTAVTVKEVVTLADGSLAETVVTSKLVAKDKNRLTVETVAVGGAGGQHGGAAEQTKTLTDYPAKVKFEHAHSQVSTGYSVTEGKEVVDLKGKQVEAEWVEATTANGDETVVEKVWTAQDVPGGIVKQTVTRKKAGKVASQSTLSVVEIAKAQPESPAKK
jgi:hypothetical protein